jgi:hypothetical protein
MNRKYVIAGLIGFLSIIGWNVFLIQRDDNLYKSYYKQQAMENLKSSPSSEIGYSAKEKFCKSQAKWHSDCNVE